MQRDGTTACLALQAPGLGDWRRKIRDNPLSCGAPRWLCPVRARCFGGRDMTAMQCNACLVLSCPPDELRVGWVAPQLTRVLSLVQGVREPVCVWVKSPRAALVVQVGGMVGGPSPESGGIQRLMGPTPESFQGCAGVSWEVL